MTNLVLLTTNSNIENLSLEKNSNQKIISFDFQTHYELEKLSIKHEIAETYLQNNDNQLIEELVYQKFLKWHKQDWVSKNIFLEDLNLGSLLDQFIGMYFLEIVKKFIYIKRILKNEQPDSILASDDLYKIISKIEFNNIKLSSISGKKQTTLYYDRIQIPIKFGQKSFAVWVSRKNFLLLKHFVEKISIKAFNLKPNLNKKYERDCVLLLDFNTMLDGDFIKDLSTMNKEIILLNERKPAIWNVETFQKIKNSNAKILRLDDFLNSTLEIEINQTNTEIQNNIEKLFSKSEFETFFSIEGQTLWPIIKDDFLNTCSKYFKEAVKRFKLSEALFKKLKIKSLLILYPNAAEESVIIHVAHKFKIPGIVIQHGIPPHTKYYEKFLSLWYPSEQNHLIRAIWDNAEQKYLKSLGINEKNFVLTGSHRLDSLFEISDNYVTDGSILVASSALAKQDESLDSSTFTSIEYSEMLQHICKISNQIPNKKLIVKLHPAQSPTFDAKTIIQSVDESIPIYKHENINPFLKNCDVLVCMEYSTILIEAMILKKPTITCLVYSDWFYDDEMIKSGATLAVKTKEDFESAIKNVLEDPEFREKLIKKGTEFVNHLLTNQGNSSELIKQLIQKF